MAISGHFTRLTRWIVNQTIVGIIFEFCRPQKGGLLLTVCACAKLLD